MYRTVYAAVVAAATLAVPLNVVGQATQPGGAGPAGGAGGGVRGGPVMLSKIVPDGKPHRFEATGQQFKIDGEPTVLIAGEMHFGRVLPEDFEARVKQAKAMGLNTLSFYLFWNLVEPQEGKFDFTGVNDIRRMFKLCQENGLWVVLRPGPYCCAEVDYGGIPWWTCKYPEVKIRTNDPKYVEWSRRYIAAVHKEIADMQVTKGGPIVMVQMENEFAMVATGQGGVNHYNYMESLHRMFKEVGFEVPLFVCDPGGFSGRGGPAQNPYGVDVLRGRNGITTAAVANQTAAWLGNFPVFSPEVYTAWFSGWGQPIATRNSTIPFITNATNGLLDAQASWTYYMFFGGTNWNYNTGCNEWLPVQTSYDYNAPVDEAGRTTPKYRALREILASRTGRTLPEPPPEPPVATLPPMTLAAWQPLLSVVPGAPARRGAKTATMEELDQAYGFVLYRKRFPNGIRGNLELQGVRDYAITMVNGKTVGKSFVGYGPESNTVALNEAGPATLDILVHNLGRISVITNAASQDRARKGLGGAMLDGKELTEGGDWEMFSLPLEKSPGGAGGGGAAGGAGPTFYRGTFHVTQPAGTFLDMRNWKFGVAWVNGHNLGRHWDRGGLRSLFVSPHFLRPGENEIVVLELHDAPANPTVASSTTIIEAPPTPFPMRLDVRVPAPANAPPAGRRGGAGGAATVPAQQPGG